VSIRSADVPPEAAGTRLDKWLAEHDSELSRSRIQRLIQDGLIQVDGRERLSSHKLRGGELVEWEVPPPEETSIEPDASVPFDIVFEDEDLAVVAKPAGIVVHPAPGHRQGTLVNGLMARLTSLSSVGGRARPGLVHRLDRDTSGLLMVAKNDAAHTALSDQLRDRSLGRVYRAICWGCPNPESGVIELPLDRHPTDRKRRAVREDGRSARTDYRLLTRLLGASSVELRLHTGRTHQIRVHLAYRGHPVLGDEMYGGGAARLRGAAPDRRPALQKALKCLENRFALHAEELHLLHPRSGEQMSFHMPSPPALQAAAAALAL
jgi:23S rRNA pseudouridine1911/1915/1917 synthase